MENKITLDLETLKKLYPLYVSIGVSLGLISGLNIRLWGFSGLIFLFTFIFCGAFYAKSVLEKFDNYKNLMNLAINGAVFTAITMLVYDILASILIAFRYEGSTSLFSVTRLIEAATIGALGAIAWYAYKKNEQDKYYS